MHKVDMETISATLCLIAIFSTNKTNNCHSYNSIKATRNIIRKARKLISSNKNNRFNKVMKRRVQT